MTEPKSYYSVRDAAGELSVSRTTIWRWIREGRLTAYRVGPRTTRIRRDDVRGLLEKPAAAGTPQVRMGDAEDIWKGYSPDKALAALEAARGALAGVNTEQLKRDIYAARGQARRKRRR